ncbi:MAG: ABC transporter permease [Puniceicoccales bacterium]|jgi:ABC-2 type transport system permease protein|nr:ABC transporter permease [Puniceicoccales bacterium]
MLYRIFSLIRKEMWTLLRDPRGRELLIVPVLMQCILFPLAATMEVKNNTLAIFNEDMGADSAEVIQRLSRMEAFSQILFLQNDEELKDAMDGQKALLAIRIPKDFSRKLRTGVATKVQAIIDGRRSNSGQIAFSYVNTVLMNYESGVRGGEWPPVAPAIEVRNWFNPNLDYYKFILPCLVALITTITAMAVTAMSVAREREQGTLDQLLVSPLTPEMILLGKAAPAFVVAAVQSSIVLGMGVFVYGAPFNGSLWLLYGAMIFYVSALVGFGLLISAFCRTQQQAFLGVFSFMMPAVLLSGFVTPVDNMPVWMQHLTIINPVRHFIVVAKGVYLKNMTLYMVAEHTLPLLVIACVTLGATVLFFRRRLVQ